MFGPNQAEVRRTNKMNEKAGILDFFSENSTKSASIYKGSKNWGRMLSCSGQGRELIHSLSTYKKQNRKKIK